MSTLDYAMWFVISFNFGVILLVGAVFLFLQWNAWQNPVDKVYPHCDIDPILHPWYCNGWIGNVEVKRPHDA